MKNGAYEPLGEEIYFNVLVMKRLVAFVIGILVLTGIEAHNVVQLDTSKSAQRQFDVAYGAKGNTIYKITKKFDLQNKTITLPSSSVLDFEGGILTNGELKGDNTRIEGALIPLFQNVRLSGTWVIDGVRVEWFGAQPNKPNYDCSDAINKSISVASVLNVPVLLSSANYYIKKTIDLNSVGMQGVNSHQSIITFNSGLSVGVYIHGQYRSFKNIRVQSVDATKKSGICVKVGDLSSKTSSTRGYIEDIVVVGGEIGLDLQYQWCQKISGVIAKNNNVGIRVSKTTTFIENAIVEDNYICGVLSTENGVKLYSSVIEGNSIGCYFNGKEHALFFCSFEGNDLKKGVTKESLKKYGISETNGGHFFVGIDRLVSYMVISGCHISQVHGSNRMVIDRCQDFVMYGNTDMSTITMTKRCKVRLKE